MIGKPFWWALEQGGIVGEDSYLSSIKTMVTPTGPDQWFGQFVVVTLLEAAADKVLQLQEDSTNDGLYGYPEFRRTFASIFPGSNVLREDEAVVLVKFLERDRGLVVSDGAVRNHVLFGCANVVTQTLAGQVIKFVRTPDEKTITAVDRGVLELRSAVFNLHRQVESLQSRCEEYVPFFSPCLCFLMRLQVNPKGQRCSCSFSKVHGSFQYTFEETTRGASFETIRCIGELGGHLDHRRGCKR